MQPSPKDFIISMMIYLLIYLILINIISFAAMGIDKSKAIKGKWRIPEKRLFLYVILGGGIGGLFGMYIFRHKTKHMSFKIGLPLITLAEYGLLIFLIYRGIIHFPSC